MYLPKIEKTSRKNILISETMRKLFLFLNFLFNLRAYFFFQNQGQSSLGSLEVLTELCPFLSRAHSILYFSNKCNFQSIFFCVKAFQEEFGRVISQLSREQSNSIFFKRTGSSFEKETTLFRSVKIYTDTVILICGVVLCTPRNVTASFVPYQVCLL